MAEPVRVLHCHSTFAAGGKEMRSVRLINAFGDAAEHSILNAMPGQLGAPRCDRHAGIRGRFPDGAPPLTGAADAAAAVARFRAT